MRPRDVIADAFDGMPGGELRGYDVADRILWALDDAGWEITRIDDEGETGPLCRRVIVNGREIWVSPGVKGAGGTAPPERGTMGG